MEMSDNRDDVIEYWRKAYNQKTVDNLFLHGSLKAALDQLNKQSKSHAITRREIIGLLAAAVLVYTAWTLIAHCS